MTEPTLLNRLKRYGYGQHYGPMAKACAEAAAEIERLRTGIAKSGHCLDIGYSKEHVSIMLRETLNGEIEDKKP